MPDLSGIPASLRSRSRWLRLAGVPAFVAHPDLPPDGETDFASLPPRPWLLWMHGRTVRKEIDPGRFQRLVRAGVATVSLDLPGHGERFEEELQAPFATMRVIARMLEEIDAVVDRVHELGGFDAERVAVGGMSAGGMVALARLCRPHRFAAAVVECTTGSWSRQTNLVASDDESTNALARSLDPIGRLDGWRPMPLLALHNRFDEWVPLAGQDAFVDALRLRYASRGADPSQLELHVYERTGAPFEHAGFGRMGADAKDRVAAFLARRLLVGTT
jgi:dienelactone hydrolase